MKPTSRAKNDPSNQESQAKPARFGTLAAPARPQMATFVRAGYVVFFLAACFTGMLGVHHTNDTWIAIATGRYILENGKVPVLDPFSYTFHGKPFFNQNWLTHLVFYWVYEHIAPDAVVLLFWLLAATVYVLVLYACWLRSRSWTAALLAAGVVAAAARHYLDIRPQISLYFLLSILCVLLHQCCVPRTRQPWWLGLLFFPILFVWGHAHGSFVFAYGLTAMFVGCWIIGHAWRRIRVRLGIPVRPGSGPAASTAQIAVICAAAVAAAALTVAVGPYGIGNFKHPKVVAGSEVFRSVAEWHPPYVTVGRGLPVWPFVWPFWVAFGIMIASILTTLAVRAAAPASASPETAKRPPAALPPFLLFDFALIAVGLYMALFARRFAPLFYVCATPPVVILLVRLAAGIRSTVQQRGRLVLAAAAWLAGAFFFPWTARAAYQDLVKKYEGLPGFDLLRRFTTAEQNPLDVIEMLRPVQTPFNVLTEWTVAGVVLAELTKARVCMDGRAQQVYDEAHYLRFTALFDPYRFDPAQARRFVDQRWGEQGFQTEAVLLRFGFGETMPLTNLLASSPEWVPVVFNARAVLFVRRGTPLLAELGTLERADKLKWPIAASTPAGRALLILATEPPEPERALRYLDEALKSDPAVGLMVYPALREVWQMLGRAGDGVAYFQRELERLRSPELPLGEEQRRRLQQAAESTLRQLQRDAAGR
jgi:hypothetical protein